MQLKEISTFSQRLQGLSSQRHTRSQEDFEIGMDCLAKAHKSNYTDKQALLEASNRLMSALQKNRRDIRPYVALAFLLILLGNDDQARNYLLEALKIDPEDESARDLLASISELKNVEVKTVDQFSQLEEALSQAEEIDYDELYETVEALILSAIRELMQTRHDPKPSLDKEAQTRYFCTLTDLNQLQDRIKSQLAIIEEEIDCSDLQAQLRPLEQLILKYKKSIDISNEFRLILSEIQAHHNTALKLMKVAHSHHPVHEASFQQLLDAVDALADRIDAYSQQKIVATEVEEPYEGLIVVITTLQELFDEI